MPELTDREIEEQLKEALAVVEEELRDRDPQAPVTLDPSPTIEEVKRAIIDLGTQVVWIRQSAERLALAAGHLGERLQPIDLDDVRALIRDDPKNAAWIIYHVRAGDPPPMAEADLLADKVAKIAEDVGLFAIAVQGRSTWRRS